MAKEMQKQVQPETGFHQMAKPVARPKPPISVTQRLIKSIGSTSPQEFEYVCFAVLFWLAAPPVFYFTALKGPGFYGFLVFLTMFTIFAAHSIFVGYREAGNPTAVKESVRDMSRAGILKRFNRYDFRDPWGRDLTRHPDFLELLPPEENG
jgi:hypothetical protein